jgi:hypothetical protein
MQHYFRWVFALSFFMAYSFVFVEYGPCPPLPDLPPPSTPVGTEVLHYATVAAVVGYGAWRTWKK